MSGGAPVPVPTSEPILSIADLRIAADRNLPRVAREFYNSGSTDQRTIRANESSLERYFLRSRVLVDVKGLDTSTTVMAGRGGGRGHKVKLPLCCAPAGIQAIAHPDGEKATARAAARFGVGQGISSFASFSIADVTGAGREAVTGRGRQGGQDEMGAFWAIQMYPMQDRALQERIIRRAEESGCVAIFLTGDSPVLGVRYNEWRNDFRTPEGIGFPILEATSEDIRKSTHESKFATFNDDSANWERDIQWLQERTKMQIFIKGVMCPEDVKLAVKWGCDGVIVSNHGGRQLDGVPATIDVLEECVDAARGTGLEVHVDGGFRRGSDLFVALALGAKCVWVGRPVLWGLACNGAQGVQRMLEVFYEDFRRCMALCGCKKIEDINRSCLARRGEDGIPKPLARESRL